MPTIVYGNKDSRSTDNKELKKQKYTYKYPKGLDLRPWSNQHQKIVDMVMERARESADTISTRFPAWNKIDETLTTYIDLSESEERVKDVDHRKPVSIIYPYSYAIKETILGYLLAAYMQDPIFRYEGRSGEDTIGAILLEKVISQHCDRSKVILNFHTMFSDFLSYGFGIVGSKWEVEKGYKITVEEDPGIFGIGARKIKTKEFGTIFEGNALFNIDPYLSLPDPNTPIGSAQQGEMLGWVDRDNLMNLLEEEKHNKNMFNVKYLKHKKGKKTTIYNTDDSERNKKAGHTNEKRDTDTFNSMDIIHMNIKLIPNDWGLGNGQYPELWKFAIGADSVIIEARPIRLVHNQIPVGIAAPDFDGYSTTPISRLETLYGLQHTLDWMFNAHVANVRKAINDTLIVDPYMVNVKDLLNPRAGGIIRTRKPAWGRGVAGAVQQLVINDITQGHMVDSGVIKEAMDRVSGVNGSMSGELRNSGPERLTGQEFQGAQQGGFTRMEKIARIIGVQAFQDIGMQFASNAQQFMNEETYIKIIGDQQERLLESYGDNVKNGRMKVDPMELVVEYDVKVRDGSIPGSNYSQAFSKLFEIVAQSPELQQQFDLPRMFMHIAENNGAKNVHEFIKVGQIPDEQAAQQAQAGNLVPMNEYLASQGGGQ